VFCEREDPIQEGGDESQPNLPVLSFRRYSSKPTFRRKTERDRFEWNRPVNP